jgi:hypothetical protein
VGNPAGARLRPDPFGLHPETLCELVSCQESVHVNGRRLSVGDVGLPSSREGLLVVMIESVWRQLRIEVLRCPANAPVASAFAGRGRAASYRRGTISA